MTKLICFQRIQTNSPCMQIGIQLIFTQYTNIFFHYFCLCYIIFLIKILIIICPYLYTLISKEWLSLSLLYEICLQFVTVHQGSKNIMASAQWSSVDILNQNNNCYLSSPLSFPLPKLILSHGILHKMNCIF